ncbi:SDR family NAD(P)-dependent oxidoreductase [Roseibium sp. CAU 1637]|uniref:SDR family NAD(P)-dependent oxidoreductase n=1 Tax=Roseibium limicola TaxID=2816037 RepID=A0A939J7E3_9HYPH|nr:SDR family NAD(P)-dependent oxidoreductase [Roseibium limicola]MBO0346087.1 SDR family NAD(P)-dependent oxidoreductase [Roseibium limicola]
MAEAYKTIVLTGASGGIGEALAKRMAKPGRHLVLIARDQKKLDALAAQVAVLGATVETASVDSRDTELMGRTLADVQQRFEIDLVIANAGVTAGLGAGNSHEALEDFDRQIDINLRGTVHTVGAVVEGMRSRLRGQVVLISSLAGMRALPEMPGYSATKAAVIAYGHSLRGWLRPFGVSVTIICPGFVTTPMSARHNGPKPLEWSAEKAADRMWRAIEAKRAFFAFPFLLAWGIRLQNLLPAKLGDIFMGGFAATIEPDPRYTKKPDV